MAPSFEGLRVLSLESRRAKEIASLISTYGGKPLVAPAVREVPLESNTAAVTFGDALMRGEIDAVVFLTGVGTRALVNVLEHTHGRDRVLAALSRTRIIARGPKPVAVLRELSLPVWVTAPEPNTWRELVAALDARAAELSLKGARIAVQEYGVPNPELLDALRARGAEVTAVPVYQWALPEDIEPLKEALQAIGRGEVDVLIVTSGIQVAHLWQVAHELKLDAALSRHLSRRVIASIGPTASEELRRRGLPPDVEASHPKMGMLVREAAVRSAAFRRAKAAGGPASGG